MKSNRKQLLAWTLVFVMLLSTVSLAGCNQSGPVTITVENGMGGGEYDIGTEVTVTAIVPNGKTFLNWSVNGKEVSKENPYTFKAEKSMTITANLQGGQSDGIIGGEELTGDWASAVYDENLEVTINWWRLQPVYFVGDTLQVSEYPVESFTDERANEVDDYETLLRIAGEDGAEELVSNAEGYTFTRAGKYTLYRYALKDGKYAKSKGFEIQVLAPDGTAPEGVELHNGAVVGGEYILKRSTVNGSMGNILEGTADFSYVAFAKEDGYGPGTWVTVTFTGKNRPNVGMFLDANHTLLGGSTGFIAGDFATYSESGSQTYLRRLTVFDYASIGQTGDIISNPVRPATFSGGLDGVNDLPCAWNLLDDSKNYEYVVGTWTEPIKGSQKSKLVLSVELYEVAADGAKTSIYKQNRDISNNGQYDYAAQVGDIVLFGSNKKEIAFSASVAVKDAQTSSGSVTTDNNSSGGSNTNGGGSGTIGSVVSFDGGELYNATATGESYTLKQSMVKGSMGNILSGGANFSYVAFMKEGGYGPGTWVSMSFTGKNRPNVGMFFDANRTLLGGTTGFILGDFATPNGGSQTYLRRLTLFDYASIGQTGDIISNPVRPANFTGASGVNDLPCAWNSLENNKNYEYVVGSWAEPIAGTEKSKLTVAVRLYEIGTDGSKTLVYSQDRDITNGGQYAYATQSGDIVLLGSNMKDITFSAKLLTESEIDDIRFPSYTVSVTNGIINGKASDTVKQGQKATVIADTPETGMRFVRWEDENGKELSKSATYEFTVTENISLTAIFVEIQKFTVTVVGGKLDGVTSKEIDAGDSVTVVADAPQAGKMFAGWKIGEETVSTKNSYTFTPEATLTITAVFADAPAAGTTETNKAQQNPDGSYTIQKSGLTAANRDNIYGTGANLDWGYVAFKGDYGAGTMVSVTFTGKNRPSFGFGHDATNTFDAESGFILGGSTSGGVSGTKGRLQIFNMNNIHTSGKLISTANRIAYTGTPLDPSVTGTSSTNSIAPAFDYLDADKTYEFVVGTWLEDLNTAAGTKKFMVNVILFEIAADGTKTCIYQQSRDANDNGRWTYENTLGDVVLYGAFDADITFSARLVEDAAEITKYNAIRKDQVWENEPEAVAVHKAQKNPDGSYTVQKSGLTAANRDNIYGAGANLDWGYVAFKGDYGAGTMVSVTFTGKNRPSFGFGHDATNTFDATTGFILGGSTSGGVSGTKGRLQIFNMNNIHTSGKLISTANRIAYTGTPLDSSVTAATSTDSIAPAFDYLDPNKTYEFIVGTWTEDLNGTAKKFMVNVILFEIAADGTKTCIYQQSRDANDSGRWTYENTPGDVVLYGAFDAELTFTAKLIEDSSEITKYNAIRKGQVWES